MTDGDQADSVVCETGASSSSSQSWSLRQTLSAKKWKEARHDILDSMLAAENTGASVCDVCGSREAVVKCRDCLPRSLLCTACDISLHQQHVLHNRCALIYGFHKPLPPTSIIVADDSSSYKVCEQACLLPMRTPKEVCSCNPQVLKVGVGRSVILITINGNVFKNLNSIKGQDS